MLMIIYFQFKCNASLTTMTSHKTISELPLCLRPREKVRERGVEYLHSHELIALILRTGNRDLNVVEMSKRILKHYNLNELRRMTLREISLMKGIGESKGAALLAAMELGNRMVKEADTISIKTPADIVHVANFIKNKRKEHFVGLYLNSRNQLISQQIISIGTINASIAHPREVFEPAIKYGATSLVLVHNHPSGSPDPSNDDIMLTRQMFSAGTILGIDLIDHIILAGNAYTSLKEKDYF